MHDIATIILAGGQGTRLFPLTEKRCKPNVSFGGRYRLIDIPLSNSLHSKIRQIYVLSQFFTTDLNQYINATYHFDLFEEEEIVLLSPEERPDGVMWYKGTADAIRKNMDQILKSTASHFLILSGDQLYNINFSSLITFAKEENADLVIASLPVQVKEAKRMGLMQIDPSSQILEFYEKPQEQSILDKFALKTEFLKKEHIENHTTAHYLGSMGIYVFKREALVALLQENGDDFGKHLIPLQIQKGNAFSFLYQGYWEDIGTIESYYNANLALLAHKNCLDIYDELQPIYSRTHNLPSASIHHASIQNSLISPGTIIEAKEISNSIIGVRCQIKSGTIIRNSILIGNQSYQPKITIPSILPTQFTIGKNCLIEKAIIEEHVHIGNGVQLINKDHLDRYDGSGIYIRDGIIIVTTGTILPDNFVL